MAIDDRSEENGVVSVAIIIVIVTVEGKRREEESKPLPACWILYNVMGEFTTLVTLYTCPLVSVLLVLLWFLLLVSTGIIRCWPKEGACGRLCKYSPGKRYYSERQDRRWKVRSI